MEDWLQVYLNLHSLQVILRFLSNKYYSATSKEENLLVVAFAQKFLLHTFICAALSLTRNANLAISHLYQV